MVITYIHRGLGYDSVMKLYVNVYHNMLIHRNVQKTKTETLLIILAKVCGSKQKLELKSGSQKGELSVSYTIPVLNRKKKDFYFLPAKSSANEIVMVRPMKSHYSLSSQFLQWRWCSPPNFLSPSLKEFFLTLSCRDLLVDHSGCRS